MPYYGYGYGYGIDPLYLLVVLVSTVIGFAAQAYIKSTYGTWSNVKSDGITGAEAARRIKATPRIKTIVQAFCVRFTTGTRAERSFIMA